MELLANSLKSCKDVKFICLTDLEVMNFESSSWNLLLKETWWHAWVLQRQELVQTLRVRPRDFIGCARFFAFGDGRGIVCGSFRCASLLQLIGFKKLPG